MPAPCPSLYHFGSQVKAERAQARCPGAAPGPGAGTSSVHVAPLTRCAAPGPRVGTIPHPSGAFGTALPPVLRAGITPVRECCFPARTGAPPRRGCRPARKFIRFLSDCPVRCHNFFGDFLMYYFCNHPWRFVLILQQGPQPIGIFIIVFTCYFIWHTCCISHLQGFLCTWPAMVWNCRLFLLHGAGRQGKNKKELNKREGF